MVEIDFHPFPPAAPLQDPPLELERALLAEACTYVFDYINFKFQ